MHCGKHAVNRVREMHDCPKSVFVVVCVCLCASEKYHNSSLFKRGKLVKLKIFFSPPNLLLLQLNSVEYVLCLNKR